MTSGYSTCYDTVAGYLSHIVKAYLFNEFVEKKFKCAVFLKNVHYLVMLYRHIINLKNNYDFNTKDKNYDKKKGHMRLKV